MLNHEPQETTTLLIDHCCGRLPASSPAPQADGAPATANGTDAVAQPHTSSLAYLNVFNSSLQLGRTAVEAAAAATAAVLPGGSTSAAAAVPTTSKAAANGTSSQEKRKAGAAPPVTADSASKLSESPADPASDPPAPPPSPTPFFAQFVNHPKEFLRFLEAVALARWGQQIDLSKSAAKGKAVAGPPPPVYEESVSSVATDADLGDQRAMWNTILELHLSFACRTNIPPREREGHRLKALRLIEQASAIPYDATHALILCSINAFTDGLVVLWEAMGMYEDVLRFWMEKEKEFAAEPPTSTASSSGGGAAPARRPSEEVMQQLRRYGPAHPYLYPLVLRFLTSSADLLSRHQPDLLHVLAVIDRERILPPLQVVQVLSRNGVASVGVVKEWLTQKVGGLRVEIESVSQRSLSRAVAPVC